MRRIAITMIAWAFFLTAAAAEPIPEKIDQGEVTALQERMMTNPAIMKLVLGLRDNPDIQAILQDPAMREALERGDVEKLLQDPRFTNLLSNPAVKEIGEQLE